MPEYKKGKIYKIECNKTGLVYYGSTCQPLSNRLHQHKVHAKREGSGITSKLIIQNNDYDIHLVENIACDTKKELLMREDFYRANNACVNKRRAYVSYDDQLKNAREHYYVNHEDNKKASLKRYYDNIDSRRQYYLDNNEVKRAYAREYYNNNKIDIKFKRDNKCINNNK